MQSTAKCIWIPTSIDRLATVCRDGARHWVRPVRHRPTSKDKAWAWAMSSFSSAGSARWKQHQGIWRYVPRAPDLHVMFGWLEVGAVIPVGSAAQAALEAFPWIADHPHVANPGAYGDQNNTLYVATAQSAIRS